MTYSRESLYLPDDFTEDLMTSYGADDEVLNKQFIEDFKKFVFNGELGAPSRELSESVLSENILKKLDVKKEELTFAHGVFVVPKDVDFSKESQEYIKGENNLPGGVYVILGNKEKVKNLFEKDGKVGVSTKENKPYNLDISGNRQFVIKSPDENVEASGEYLYNRCHLLGKALEDNTRSNFIRKYVNAKRNIIISTSWLVRGNHNFKLGLNKNYIEEKFREILEKNYSAIIRYKVVPLFENGEVVPRGLHIQAKVDGKAENLGRLFKESRELNLFLPNVDPRFKVRYKR